jgi:hypothetical protein
MVEQKRMKGRRYWETLTDDQLLEAELETDDPQSLEGLTSELPLGGEEPYVEFKYDLRNSGHDELICVHGHHRHLAGFVMRKGDDRYLVGWICGKTIYGEEFESYKSDFYAAVNRKDTLRRLSELRRLTSELVHWLDQFFNSNIFDNYERIRLQLEERMPWVWKRAALTPEYVTTPVEIRFPKSIFDESTDPRASCGRVVSDLAAFSLKLNSRNSSQEETVHDLIKTLESLIRRIDRVRETVKELDDLFQPAILKSICMFANKYDNPKKRTYTSGMLSLSCKRDKGNTIVQAPNRFSMPRDDVLLRIATSIREL